MNQSQDADVIEGRVLRTTFFNAENGFVICKIQTATNEDEQCVIGNCSYQPAYGAHLTATGKWITDARYGRQFKASEISIKIPTEPGALVEYIASELPGVGMATAKKIVDHFGAETQAVLGDHARLSEIKGLKGKKGLAIAKAWNERADDREAVIFLRSLEIPHKLSLKILKWLGVNDVERLIRVNPYRLVDMRGIGFTTADKIASVLKVARDSPFRLQAGIFYALQKRAELGHTVANRATLAAETSKLLNISEDLIDPQIDIAVDIKRIVERSRTAGPLYLLPNIDRCERSIVENIIRLTVHRRHKEPPSLSMIKERFGITPDASQLDAIHMVNNNSVSIITGGPGCGKTTITKIICDLFNGQMLLGAPTGRAGKRLSQATGRDASTFHRMLEVEMDPNSGKFVFHYNRHNQFSIHPPKSSLLIIGDEISMLDTELASSWLDAVPATSTIVFIGDPDQLPPVGSGNVLADLIAAGVPTVSLTHIHRTDKDSPIPYIARSIINGIAPHLPTTGAARHIESSDPKTLIQVVRGMLKAGIPPDDIQVLSPMRKGPMGIWKSNASLQRLMNPQGILQGGVPTGLTYNESEDEKAVEKLCIGDRVMQTRNNYRTHDDEDKKLFNGDILRVTSHSREADEKTFVECEMMDQNGVFSYRLIEDEIGDLTLAYASTIHKGQGAEYPHVIILLTAAHYVMLSRRLLYTAVTRARKTLTIVGEQKAIVMACKDLSAVANRDTGLVDLLREPLADVHMMIAA